MLDQHLKHAIVAGLFFMPFSAQALEVTRDELWLKEESDKKYFYLSFRPDEAAVNKLVQTLLKGAWKMDVVGYGNDINSFRARIVSNNLDATPPQFNYNENWLSKAYSRSAEAVSIKGSPEEINEYIVNKQKSGYRILAQAKNTPSGTFKYVFVKD